MHVHALQNKDEASIFFGNVRHEYGGNLEVGGRGSMAPAALLHAQRALCGRAPPAPARPPCGCCCSLSAAAVQLASTLLLDRPTDWCHALQNMREYCARRNNAGSTGCQANGYGGGGAFYGRGPMQLTHDYNYRSAATFMGGADIVANPDALGDNSRDLAWRAAMAYWARDSNMLCLGKWGALASLPTCPEAARAGNVALVTRRINGAVECDKGTPSASQQQRVALVNEVRTQAFSLPALTTNLYC
jgi:predicted chitinase